MERKIDYYTYKDNTVLDPKTGMRVSSEKETGGIVHGILLKEIIMAEKVEAES